MEYAATPSSLGGVIATLPQLHNNTFTLDVSSWPSGAYLLRIHTPQGIATKKLQLH